MALPELEARCFSTQISPSPFMPADATIKSNKNNRFPTLAYCSTKQKTRIHQKITIKLFLLQESLIFAFQQHTMVIPGVVSSAKPKNNRLAKEEIGTPLLFLILETLGKCSGDYFFFTRHCLSVLPFSTQVEGTLFLLLPSLCVHLQD